MKGFVQRLVLIVVLALATAACRRGAPDPRFGADQVSNAMLRITPGEIRVRGDRLFVKTTLINTSDKTLVVERDAIRIKLADGRTFRRSTGVTSTHKPYTVAPNATQSVWFDFLPAEDFDWSTVGSAEIDFSEAVHVGSDAVPVPPIVLRREDVVPAPKP